MQKYLDEGDGLGAAVGDDERVLDVPCDGQDEDHEELDHAHGEELVHLLLTIEREHRVPERAAALLQEFRGWGRDGMRGVRGRWVDGHQGLSMADNALFPWFEVCISSPVTRHRRPPLTST